MLSLATLYETYRDQLIVARYRLLLNATLRRIEKLRTLSRHELMTELMGAKAGLKTILGADPSRADGLLPEAYATFSEAARLCFGYAPNVTQLFAAILLWHGKVIEMRSGEGKTLTAALPTYLQALTGKGMHMITTNDYLAERDKEWMGRVFDRLDISCGVVTQTTPRETRKKEYAKDITYVSNQEVGFDYLRDNLVMRENEKVLRGFPFAIIDEADSILIDEARTSLIISNAVAPAKFALVPKLLEVVSNLEAGRDYEVDPRFKSVDFTDAGVQRVVDLLGRDVFVEKDPEVLQQLRLALYVKAFYQPDRDYMILDGKFILIDEFTGHPKWDYRLLYGLQQVAELSAGVPPSMENEIIASITYRSLYGKYQKVSGMSGTVMAAQEEFSKLYGLEAFEMTPHHRVARRDLPVLFFRTQEEKSGYILLDIEEKHERGIPILVVGRSIASAKRLGALLAAQGLPHQLLHAAVTGKEFDIIGNAGKRGAITVATNMAGRGADIILDQEFKEQNGLAVYGLEPNLSRRIDNQLRGRAGRQGQPGETRIFASLHDELFQVYADDKFWDYAERVPWVPSGVYDKKLEALLLAAQDFAESLAAEERRLAASLDGFIDERREALYKMREGLLASDDIVSGTIAQARQILFGGGVHAKSGHQLFRIRVELIDVLKRSVAERLLAEDSLDVLNQVVRSVTEGETRKSPPVGGLPALSRDAQEEMRRALLGLLDGEWQSYLEQAEWLKGWIFLEASAGRDPLADFLERSDAMFHEMQKEFALQALRLLFVAFLDASGEHGSGISPA